MKFSLHEHGSCLAIDLQGRLDSLEIDEWFWADLEHRLTEALGPLPGTALYVDLRLVSYGDSRSLFHLLSVLEKFRATNPVTFVGPGEGLRRRSTSSARVGRS